MATETPATPTAGDQRTMTHRIREDRRDAQPTIARLQEPSRSQRPVEIAPLADVIATSEQPSRQSAELNRMALAVQATGIERASPQTPPRREEGANAPSFSDMQQITQLEGIAPTRTHPTENPSITPRASSEGPPRRTLEVADVSKSPAEAPSSLAAQNSSQNRAGPAPNALACQRVFVTVQRIKQLTGRIKHDR